MASIILASDFDIKKIKIGNVRTLDNGSRSVYVAHNGAPIILQTPEMYAPAGLKKWEKENKEKGTVDVSYTMELSFKGREERQTLQQFYTMLEEMDKRFKEEGMKQSQSFFKKKITSMEVIEEKYTDMVRHSKDESGNITDKYPPSFRLKLPFRNGKFGMEVFNKKREQIDITEIPTKGARVVAIIQCMGLWISAAGFGCSWKVVQLQVTPPAYIKGYAFKETNEELADDKEGKDDDALPDADEIKQYALIEKKKPAPPPVTTKVEDSDEEEEEAQDDNKVLGNEEEDDDEEEEEEEEDEKPVPAVAVEAKKHEVVVEEEDEEEEEEEKPVAKKVTKAAPAKRKTPAKK